MKIESGIEKVQALIAIHNGYTILFLCFPEWLILLSNTEFMSTQSQPCRPDNGNVREKRKEKARMLGKY